MEATASEMYLGCSRGPQALVLLFFNGVPGQKSYLLPSILSAGLYDSSK
jgi:hypothetical protein